MNGVHDCGGMARLGQIERVENEPVFYADWERRAFGLLHAAGSLGHWNLDEIRHAVENMDVIEYLSTPYYEHWIRGIESQLLDKGVITEEELAAKRRQIVAQMENN
jgi:hypothetical protein